ncbi:50S ribosomal protein L28 [Blattabacterium cuenoti]|uniref:50S ribosomal protein L28 n=1 Tax=Blattabacterium cuenoti TaxID=1653831 RepID=UPI00163D270C|nr:50S ribosomal protein L28 [Blattabacterium cuenoti]
MSNVCELTGKKVMIGNKVSHSNNRNKRFFKINLCKKRFFITTKKKWITVKVSTYAIRIINKIGIEKALQRFKYKIY